MSERVIENFFVCVGAQKAGTTWLARVLATHPDLFLTPVKEIHYFDHVRGITEHLSDKKRQSRYRKFHQRMWTQWHKFSDFRDQLDTKANKQRFFAGIPKVPNKDKDKMAIYLLFIQHIIASLSKKGKAAIVVPTGFITAQSGIEKGIREHLVENKMLAGVVSMPSNIFATTGTNVSILFLDATNQGDVILIDASNLGTKVKEGKNQKTLLSHDDEEQIIRVFNAKEAVEDFSVVVSYDDIAAKNCSLSAGQYFDVKVEHVEMTPEEFVSRLEEHTRTLRGLFDKSRDAEKQIEKQLSSLKLND